MLYDDFDELMVRGKKFFDGLRREGAFERSNMVDLALLNSRLVGFSTSISKTLSRAHEKLGTAGTDRVDPASVFLLH